MLISNNNIFRVLFDIIEKYIVIFQHRKWPDQGTSTVPIVSAHFRYQLLSWRRTPWYMARSESVIRALKAPPLSRCRLPCRPPPRQSNPLSGYFSPVGRPSPSLSRAVISFLRRHVTFWTPPPKSDPISRNFWPNVAPYRHKADWDESWVMGKATVTPSDGQLTKIL